MRHMPAALGAAVAVLAAACSTPAPSRLGPAHWWNGSGFVVGSRDIQAGRIVPADTQISEEVDLAGAFAVPARPPCGSRRFAFDPGAGALSPGSAADFWLLSSDPSQEPPKVLALVCGGHLHEAVE